MREGEYGRCDVNTASAGVLEIAYCAIGRTIRLSEGTIRRTDGGSHLKVLLGNAFGPHMTHPK